MKKLIIVLLVVVSLILLGGCVKEEVKEPLCKTPYIEYKTGECCLDKNSNQICDTDEEIKVVSIIGTDTTHLVNTTGNPTPSLENLEEEKEEEESSCAYVGSKNSDKYHYPSCRWAKKIYPENLVCFKSVSDAKSKGYKACKVCHPPS